MIYISNSLYISLIQSSGDFNGNNPIIGYHSVLTPDDIRVVESTSQLPPQNMWTPDTSTVWIGQAYSGAPSTVERIIYLDNPLLASVDYVGIARHNLGDTGWEYIVQSSVDGVVWADITAPKIIATNAAIISCFDPRTNPFFRIKLTTTASEVTAPIIAHVKMGVALILQRRIFDGVEPPTLSPKVRRESLGSESGQYLGQIVTRKYHTASCQQENNTPEFVRTKIVPFINHINGDVVVNDTAQATFFFAWRPMSYPDEVIYAWTSDHITPQIQTGDSYGGLMKWGFNMEAIA